MAVSRSQSENTNKIKTFVFLDLETSRLGGYDCRILELCMIAVAREDLLNMKNSISNGLSLRGNRSSDIPKLPRILQKYTRLYRPRITIDAKAQEITGLSTELLKKQTSFSSESADALNLFLNLPKPITFVSHYGKKFDFPLLKAELDHVIGDVDNLENFRGLWCTDSLLAFRKLEQESQDIFEITFTFMKLEQESEEIDQITSMAESFSCQDMACEPDGNRARGNGDEEESGKVTIPKCYDLPAQPLKKSHVLTTNTSLKTRIAQTFPVPSLGILKGKQHGALSFKLVNLYQTLFGVSYEAHRAESDNIALLEICGFYGHSFVDWADRNSTRFAKVNQMWKRRKTS